MNPWTRPLGYVALLGAVAGAYFIGLAGRRNNASDIGTTLAPDPGYAARDAVVIETGYDGRERYRLNAKIIRQQSESGAIDLEQLQMDYHPGAQGEVPGERPVDPQAAAAIWHLKSDRGHVQSNGDDVQLNGNVQVTGPAPGSDLPLTLTTETMRINTPTEFIETEAPVRVRWSGNVLDAVGMEADLKSGNVRLKSAVHGSSAH